MLIELSLQIFNQSLKLIFQYMKVVFVLYNYVAKLQKVSLHYDRECSEPNEIAHLQFLIIDVNIFLAPWCTYASYM